MRHFIDRRLNPKQKSLGNRQRFMRRARAEIKEVVNKSIKDRTVEDVSSGEAITIPTKGIREPRFHHDASGGKRQRTFTGNKQFNAGDKIPKPPSGGEGAGKQATDQGIAHDERSAAAVE